MSSRVLSPQADAAVDPLWDVDPELVGDDEITPTLVEARRQAARIEAATARLIGEAERRGLPLSGGFGSTTSWLIAVSGDPPGVCRSRVRVARRLRHMPVTREAFGTGELSECRVRVLVEAAETAPETFVRDEAVLVDQARRLDAHTFPKAIAHWRRLADQDRSTDDQERLLERRGLFASETWGGMVRIDGNLDPESGAIFTTALRSITGPQQLDPGDLRSPAQRRADALTELSRFFLDHAPTAISGGDKPHVTVTVDLETLEGRAERRCQLDSGGDITPEAALRLACDAQITRIITQGHSQPLDVGRATRTVPTGIRKALVTRDGGCTHPGCGIPAAWCDAHHITHWAHGGPTTLDNLKLLCRRHHRTTHHHHPKRE